MFGPEIIASAVEHCTTKIGGFDYDLEYAVEVERMEGWDDMLLIFNGYEKRNMRIPLEHLGSLLKALHSVEEQLSLGTAQDVPQVDESKESIHAD